MPSRRRTKLLPYLQKKKNTLKREKGVAVCISARLSEDGDATGRIPTHSKPCCKPSQKCKRMGEKVTRPLSSSSTQVIEHAASLGNPSRSLGGEEDEETSLLRKNSPTRYFDKIL